MQDKEKKYLDGFLNAEDEKNALQPNAVINAENMRFIDGLWQAVPSNAVLTNSLPAGTNTRIGNVASEDGKYIVFFVHNSGNLHRIFLYYKPTNTFWTVMTGSELGFSKDKLIQARLVNGIVYWTDNTNEPRRINLAAAIKMNHAGTSPISSSWQFTNITDLYEYTLIRRPPCLAGSITKATDGTYQNNFIQNASFQAAFMYEYHDGEESVTSPWTRSTRLNSIGDTFNCVDITFNINEVIRESVKQVHLVVRYGGDIGGSWGPAFRIKKWDSVLDAGAITSHNTALFPLTFRFYSDIVGEPLAPFLTTKQFDSVPRRCEGLEIESNRLFLSNLFTGYNTPATTSLAYSLGTFNLVAGQTFTTPMSRVALWEAKTSGATITYSYNYTSWAIYISATFGNNWTPGWYAITSTEATAQSANGASYGPPPVIIAPTGSVALAGLVYRGLDISAFKKSVQPVGFVAAAGTVTLSSGGADPTANAITITGLSTYTAGLFKSLSQLQLGIVFYDKALRRCGVLTNTGQKVQIPARNFALSTGTGSIIWSLNNAGALTEIPDWAHYYAVVSTMNLRTRSFVQSYDEFNAAAATGIKYATKDKNGDYVFTQTVYTQTAVGIAIDATGLEQANLGYVFTEGDECILIRDDNTVYQLPVIATDGKYVIVKLRDIGNLSAKKFVYELYTPYKAQVEEPFFEMGELCQVTNAGTSSRAYSQTTGTLAPDVFALSRTYNATTYYAEAMCPNDKFWKRWDTDHGKINIITDKGETSLPTAVQFSDTYIQGTQTNGLSTYEALNRTILPTEMGAVRALINVQKIGGGIEGGVMLALGQGGTRCCSIYIGVTQVTNADSTNYFIKAEGVIGQVNPLRGDYGTNNPESIIVNNGNAWFFDTVKGKFIQYSTNGLDDISDGENGMFKFQRVSEALGKKYLTTLAATIEGFGSRPFIFGGIDMANKELYWTFPKLSNTVPKGTLSDYGTLPAYLANADYQYDILDYKAKTLVFKLGEGRWMGAYNIPAEGWANLNNELYAFKNGQLYIQNQTGTGNFYGVQYKPRLMFVCNKDNMVKELRSLAVEGTLPEWVHFRSEYPYVQSSDLIAADFKDREGIYYADILRDRLSPNVAGTAEAKMMQGDTMREQAALICIQWSGDARLRIVTIGYNISTGHY